MAARIGGCRTNVLRNDELGIVLPSIVIDSLQSIISDEKKRSRGVDTVSQHIKIDNRRRFAGPSSEESSLSQIEDDDQIQSISLSTSRWADDDDCNHLDEAGWEEKPKRRKITPHDVSISRHSSPELGEIISREGSASAESNSYVSEGEQDYMVVDGESTDQIYDTDVEAEDDLDQQTQRHFNMLHSCRSVDEFENLGKISEGTYGIVFKARDKKTGELVALKKVKLEKQTEGFPLTALREINILLSLSHPSIVNVKEVVVDGFDSVFLVMEYMEHDLKSLMEKMKRRFSESEVKCLMIQLLEGVKHLHDNWVLHRDLKTSNILVNNHGELKICDFGLARQYGSPLKQYTHMVVTLWYRAPELLLGGKEYSTAIDMWSLGCIMAELLAKEPLFNGEKELDQLNKIFQILGTPNERIWPGFSKLPGSRANFSRKPYNNNLREKFPPVTLFGRPKLSEAGFDLLSRLLAYDPKKRISVEDALKHEWFHEEPLPKAKEFMPSFPDRHLRR